MISWPHWCIQNVTKDWLPGGTSLCCVLAPWNQNGEGSCRVCKSYSSKYWLLLGKTACLFPCRYLPSEASIHVWYSTCRNVLNSNHRPLTVRYSNVFLKFITRMIHSNDWVIYQGLFSGMSLPKRKCLSTQIRPLTVVCCRYTNQLTFTSPG